MQQLERNLYISLLLWLQVELLSTSHLNSFRAVQLIQVKGKPATDQLKIIQHIYSIIMFMKWIYIINDKNHMYILHLMTAKYIKLCLSNIHRLLPLFILHACSETTWNMRQSHGNGLSESAPEFGTQEHYGLF